MESPVRYPPGVPLLHDLHFLSLFLSLSIAFLPVSFLLCVPFLPSRSHAAQHAEKVSAHEWLLVARLLAFLQLTWVTHEPGKKTWAGELQPGAAGSAAGAEKADPWELGQSCVVQQSPLTRLLSCALLPLNYSGTCPAPVWEILVSVAQGPRCLLSKV